MLIRRRAPKALTRLTIHPRTMTPATKTIGLVLSGGGVRGAAHVGLIRALLEEGIAPQLIEIGRAHV